MQTDTLHPLPLRSVKLLPSPLSNLRLMPLYNVRDERYTVYFPVQRQ